ncbi:response regulator [Candidatus Falkowbacteria bacterium]|nr:response regulator [Candidatus Falkowbacteria bacterium]
MNKKKKILVVEDDIDQAAMYQVALKAAGFTVIVARNGQEGIEVATSKKPDLIFLDMLLPDMDGLEVLKNLKSVDTTKSIKVIVLSNLNKQEVINQSKKAGADDFMIKMQLLPRDVVARAIECLI